MMKPLMTQDDSTKDDDADLFRQAMRDVEPLKSEDRIRRRPVRKTAKDARRRQTTPVDDVFSDANIEECPDTLDFARAGVQASTLKKLRRGKLPIENRIDLHGMTVDQARDYLREFLAECETAGARCVLIVHGKGFSSPGARPVIKPLVNKWLRLVSSVLAFHSAIPADGGKGAVYVLLKKL